MPFLNTLDPETLQQLQTLSLGQSVTLGGVTYSPLGLASGGEGESGSTVTGYTGFGPGVDPTKPGAQGAEYDISGTGYLPYETVHGGDFKWSDFKDLGQAAATLFSMYLGGQGLAAMGAGEAAGGAAEAAGTAGAAADTGVDYLPAAFNAAKDSEAASEALGLTAGDVSAGETLPSVFNAAKDSEAASEALGLTAADTTSAGIPSVGTAGNIPIPGQVTLLPGVESAVIPGVTPGVTPGTVDNVASVLPGLIPGITSLVSGLSGSDLANDILNKSDPFRDYRDMYAKKLNALWGDPSTITQMPGYQSGLTAVERSMGAQGYTGSGNMMTALSQYGGGQFDKTLQQLMALSGANVNPGNGALGAAQLASASQGSLGYGISQLATPVTQFIQNLANGN